MTLPNAILTETEVSTIKAAIYKGQPLEEIASKYEVSYKTISHIKCGRTWEAIQWPDGSKGGIPGKKRTELVRMRMAQRVAAKPNGKAKRSKRRAK